MKISREEFKAKKRGEREVKEAKYARLRIVASKYPRHVSAAIIELANAFHEIGEGLHAFNDNLGLATPPKTASLAVRAAAAKKYASEFRRLAEENPEEMAVALNEVYNNINDLAEGIEALAENTGIPLQAPVADESVADEFAEGHETVEGPQFIEEELAEADQAAEAGDMPEAAAEAHDAEEAAVAEELPVEASTEVVAGGADAWTTDRDEEGRPREPKVAFLRKRRK